jgi:hypothetical protein
MQLASDWPPLRLEMAAAFARNEVLYGSVADAATGSLRADARLVAGFMPRSRAVLLESASLVAYRAAVTQVPGDSAVRAAATRINADAADACGIRMVQAPPPSTAAP